VDLSYNNKQ